MARPVGRQQHVRADEHGAAAGSVELHVVFGLRQRIVRNGLELIGEAIGAAIGPEYARHGARLRKIHAADARMRVGRTHHRKPALTRRAKVVAEAAGPGDEPGVFLASEWGADETKLRWVVHGSDAGRGALR